MKNILLLAGLAAGFVPGAAYGQQPDRLLAGRTIERTITVGQAHSFALTVDSGRFVVGEAMQHGIDVQVAIVTPKGDTLAKFDSPNGTEGPEPFTFTTKARGDYQVVVAPLTTATGTGRYTLVLKRVVAAATTPAGKVDQLMANVDPAGPGVVAAVVRNGRLTYQKSWGLANLTHKVPFTVNTITNIGSTSKQFTTFAILMLAHQNELSIDDDVRKHIPELPDLGQTVTIRHLMTHTSGYREFLNALALAGRRIDFGDYIDRFEVINLLKRQPALQNVPGAEFNYNNSGYSLLATIVERVGGKPFPAWMQDNVFKPLGMTNTLVRATAGQVIPNSAQGYTAMPGGFREAQDIGASMGAGGIYTTIADLTAWMRNFRTQTVGPPGFFQQMTTRNVLTKGDTSSYAFGLFVEKWRGLTRVQHGGADIAHRSAFHYFPELDAGVIVQSNNASTNAESYAAQIAQFYFADHLKETPAPVATTFDPATFDSTRLDTYAGRYELTEMPGFILSFTRRDGRFIGQATGQPEIDLTATSDSTFVITRVNAMVTFHREPDGSVKRLTLNQNGVHPGVRVAETPAAKPNLADYAGRYFSEELEVFYQISVTGDSLMLSTRRMLPMKLNHQRGEVFSAGFPIATLTFERNAAGQVTGFKAGNGRTRDVVFRKQD